MARYFIRLMYNGENYAGFQIQQNADSVQAAVERALKIFFRFPIELTCSSRTDAGVHALNNFFHFDTDRITNPDLLNRAVYNLNSILPPDIAIKSINQVPDDWHSRFTANGREYRYQLYHSKQPFLADRAFFYPYRLNIDLLNQSAAILKEYNDFTTFSKRNTQVKTFNCTITESEWLFENEMIIYRVKANRFLRGMVRGLVGTMLKVGTQKISVDEFRKIIESRNCSNADFSVPPHGLFLIDVFYPGDILT